eukprot:GILJ01009067.1.p1 GENE.GILJ01009067.1~~GILJ01009067.1.p1  ORF type:complete len:340 (-),score=19.10 GILJ01009067.1:185-1204(-)
MAQMRWSTFDFGPHTSLLQKIHSSMSVFEEELQKKLRDKNVNANLVLGTFVITYVSENSVKHHCFRLPYVFGSGLPLKLSSLEQIMSVYNVSSLWERFSVANPDESVLGLQTKLHQSQGTYEQRWREIGRRLQNIKVPTLSEWNATNLHLARTQQHEFSNATNSITCEMTKFATDLKHLLASFHNILANEFCSELGLIHYLNSDEFQVLFREELRQCGENISALTFLFSLHSSNDTCSKCVHRMTEFMSSKVLADIRTIGDLQVIYSSRRHDGRFAREHESPVCNSILPNRDLVWYHTIAVPPTIKGFLEDDELAATIEQLWATEGEQFQADAVSTVAP